MNINTNFVKNKKRSRLVGSLEEVKFKHGMSLITTIIKGHFQLNLKILLLLPLPKKLKWLLSHY